MGRRARLGYLSRGPEFLDMPLALVSCNALISALLLDDTRVIYIFICYVFLLCNL